MKLNRHLTILFADIVGSTNLYEELGDNQAQEATSNCLQHISKQVEAHRGTLIKTIGDEIMCTFQSAEEAGNAAIAIQESLCTFYPLPELQLKVKIGFHFGAVIIQDNDIFGDAVNLAARVTSQAKAQQIITTTETVQRMSKSLQLSSRQLDITKIKGKTKPVQLSELTWGEVSDLTIIGNPSQAPLFSNTSLKLLYQDQIIVINNTNPTFTIGRDNSNSLVITDPLISRYHSIIEYQTDGSFFITDRSTNGAFVTNTQGEEQFLHRNVAKLEGSGLIALGKRMSPTSTSVIYYDATYTPEVL